VENTRAKQVPCAKLYHNYERRQKEIYLEEIDTWKLHYFNGSNSSEQKMGDVGQVLQKQDIYLAA
jgi:hypothetical protein